MKEYFSLLNEGERKKLRLLSLLLVVGVLFLVFVLFGQRRSFHSLQGRLLARQKVLTETEAKRAQSAGEWARWQGAYRDIAELEKTYFYQAGGDLQQLRLDLENVFAEAGLSARVLKYDYSRPGRETIDKVSISFTFIGSYAILKKFLEVVERLPKFLMVEKIDFARISGEGSILELRVVLAAYYESL